MDLIVGGMLVTVALAVVGQICVLIFSATHKPTVGDRMRRDRAWMAEMSERHENGRTR